MWKKPDLDSQDSAPVAPAGIAPTSPAPEKAARSHAAVIGPSITINGDVTGDEDLIVQGRIDGVIKLKQNNVTIGQQGVVSASISANIITIEGKSHGDLNGDEKVIIRKTGHVEGNIIAPRVVLEDGAVFKGSIDMTGRQPAKAAVKPETKTEQPVAKPAVAPAKAVN